MESPEVVNSPDRQASPQGHSRSPKAGSAVMLVGSESGVSAQLQYLKEDREDQLLIKISLLTLGWKPLPLA